MRASIIVSNVQSHGKLIPCIQALCNQDIPPTEYEIILPDYQNFSREERHILEEISKQYPHFRILKTPFTNRSAIINTAVRETKSDLLLFIESHGIPRKNWVRAFLKAFADKNVLAARGKLSTIPTKDLLGRAEQHHLGDVITNIKARGMGKSFFDFHNSGLRKHAYWNAGGLSEYIPIMCEFELGTKIHQKGIPITFVPEADVMHMHNTAFWKYDQVVFAQGRDRARMLRKHGKQFIKEYFPSKKFLALVPFVRTCRLPFYVLCRFIVGTTIIGFKTAELLGLKKTAYHLFHWFAAASHWSGIAYGLR